MEESHTGEQTSQVSATEMSKEIERFELKYCKNARENFLVEFGWEEERERGQAHPLGGQVGPTPHGGAAHTPAVPS